MHNLAQSIIRILAFVRKEISEVLRQPRLLFTLVLGPFLILLIFGVGYRNEARALRTLFVAQPDSELSAKIEEYASSLGPQLIFMGIEPDENTALNRLRRGEVDVVAVTPPDAYNTIRNSQHATFILYNHEIDPLQVDYVRYFGQVYIDEVNRRVLLSITEQGQRDAGQVKDDVRQARENAAALRQAYQAGDEISARQNRAELSSNVNAISLALGASAAVLGGVQRELGGAPTENQDLLTPLSSVQDNTDALEAEDTASDAQKEQRATEIEKDLAVLDERLSEFTSIDANVLVRPFTSEARSTAPVQPDALQFFAPAVVALLLQHLAITFAALSIVRERSVGTMELFRVSPLTAGETLLGKYLSYMIFGGILTAILISLLVYGLKVPMLGNWWNIVLVVGALLFTSLGIGFILSLISQTDSQAVQYTMLTLLTAVFFSGFILTLDMIWQPVRVVSWALPTTYGIILLRDIMLRGIAPNIMLVGGLIALGVGLCILAWIMLRRMITTREKESG